MKLIDLDELLANVEADMVIQDIIVASDRDARILENLMRDILNDIKESPIVDAVPVVRCKDCKYYEEQDETIGTCLLTESGAHVKGYCAWAERKEHETD